MASLVNTTVTSAAGSAVALTAKGGNDIVDNILLDLKNNSDSTVLNIRNNGALYGLAGTFKSATGSVGLTVGNTTGDTRLDITSSENSDVTFNVCDAADGGTSRALIIKTGSSERMRIAADGKVGIGTTDPAELFHVNGNGRFDDYLSVNTSGKYQTLTVNGNIWLPGSSGTITWSNGDCYIQSVSGYHMRLVTYDGVSAGVENLRLKSGGNVGVNGITDPLAPLHVKDKVDNSDASGIIIERSANTQRGYISMRGGAFSFNTDTGLPIKFKDGGGTNMTILGDGNVGIGIESPTYKLHVSATSTTLARFDGGSANNWVSITSSDTYSAGIVYENAGTGKWYVGHYNGAPGGFSFYDASTSSVKVFIEEGGNVGIGTTAPGAKLEVRGGSAAIPNLGTYGSLFNLRRADGHIGLSIDIDSATNNFWFQAQNSTSPVAQAIILNPKGGKVGIGTDSPDYTLTVNSGTTNEIARFQSSDNDALISIKDDTDAVYVGLDASADIMSLGFSNSFASTNLNIDTGGKVGIGINSPVAKLHIDDSATGDNKALYIQNTHNTDGDSAAIRFGFAGNDNANKGGIFFKRTANYGRGSLIFATENTANDDNVENSDAKLTINSDGEVGIGTNDPTQQLMVWEGSSSVSLGEWSNGAVIWLDGVNGDISGGDYYHILADDSTALRFGYGATHKVSMLNNGYVGIGTTDPTVQLEVSGTNPAIDLSQGGTNIFRTELDGANDVYQTVYGAGNQWILRTNGGTAALTINASQNATFAGTMACTTAYATQVQINTGSPILIMKDTDHTGASQVGYVSFLDSAGAEKGWMGYGSSGNTHLTIKNGHSGSQVVLDAPTTSVTGNLTVNSITSYSGSTTAFDDDVIIGGANATTSNLLYFHDTGGQEWYMAYDGGLKFVETGITQHVKFVDGGQVLIGSATTNGGKLMVSNSDNTVYDASQASHQRDEGSTLMINNESTTAGSFSQLLLRNRSSSVGGCRIVSIDSGADDSELAIVTGDTGESMRIIGDGNVGIGTTGPGSALNIYFASQKQVDFYSGTSPSGNNYVAALKLGRGKASNSALEIKYDSENAEHAYISRLYTNATLHFDLQGTDQMTIQGDGNVGIGTNAPSELLEVKGNMTLRGATNLRYKIANDSNNNWAEIGNDGATGENTLEFFTGSSSVPSMSITNSKLVGIGTNDPTNPLSVIDNTASATVYANFGPTTIDGTTREGGLQIHASSGSADKTWGIFADANPNSFNINYLGARATAISGGTNVLSISNTGGVTITGTATATTFSGSGASLTSLNASNLGSGTVPTARLGSGTASSSTYLRGDNTWATVSGGSGTVTSVATSGAITGGTITTSGTITHSTANGYKHIPADGADLKFLAYASAGTAEWAGGLLNYGDYALFAQRYDDGSSGGALSGGQWNTRILNTTVVNNYTTGSAWASLSSNKISLQAGTYYARVWAVAYDIDEQQINLANVTTGNTLLLTAPMSTKGTSPSNPAVAMSEGTFAITTNGHEVIAYHWANTAETNTYGGGRPLEGGTQSPTAGIDYDYDTYVSVQIWRVA
tara:strand:+ start:2372 stop:7039 length:4668 start_codon:yes stop_codon:yes gene_type:complete